jgi:hypothetical protein
MGRCNFHLEIRFEDSTRWIARIKRQNSETPPASVCEYLIRSETATYRFLEKTSVPAPMVHEAISDPENPVHVPYMLGAWPANQPLCGCNPGAVAKGNDAVREHISRTSKVSFRNDRFSGWS